MEQSKFLKQALKAIEKNKYVFEALEEYDRTFEPIEKILERKSISKKNWG